MNKTIFVILLVLLYLTPTFLQVRYSEKNTINSLYFGLPITHTGDEPHYYITLYSLVNDGDIFLTNNYNNALHKGLPDLGMKKFNIDDRHTRLFDTEKRKVTNIPFLGTTTLNLSVIPDENSAIKEVSGHPLGLPFFSFLFLWPFKQTLFLEHAAIYLTLTFSLLGVLAFYKIILFYHNDNTKALLFTLLFALGTQYWHYSKTFWAEPYLASILIISWYLILNKEYVVAGILLGFGFLIKYPFLLLIIPFFIFLIWTSNQKKIKSIITFSIPLFFSFISAIFLNKYLTGNILSFNQAEAVQFVIPFRGMIKWLFDPIFGLISFSPILIFSSFGFKNFLKTKKEHCLALSIGIFLYFLFWTAYIVSQTGGGGYSARYLLPIIPVLIIITSFMSFKNKKVLLLFLFFALCSIAINFLASFAYPAFIGNSLLTALQKIYQFIL